MQSFFLFLTTVLPILVKGAVIAMAADSGVASNHVEAQVGRKIESGLSLNDQILSGHAVLVENSKVPENSQQDFEKQIEIEKFFRKLKSFIFKGTFDIVGFGYESKELKQTHDEICNSADSKNPELAAQINFVSGFFQLMQDAAKDLISYNLSALPGHRWVYRIIELNIRLIVLFDSRGSLDVNFKNYEQKLFMFWRSIHVWGNSFRQIPGISKEMRTIFEERSFEAEKSLATLARQLSDED